MRGVGLVGGRMVNSSGRFFFVWTLMALGVTALFSVILSLRGLWSLRRAAQQIGSTLIRVNLRLNPRSRRPQSSKNLEK